MRKKVTQWVSVSVGVPFRPVSPAGSFGKGRGDLRLVHFLMSHPLPIWGRAATGIDLGEEEITGNGTVFGAERVMTYDPEKHHRRSIRLKGYDYTQPGAYFITICTQGRACLFGEIIDGEMHLNEAGQIVVQTWQDLPNHISNVQLDAFVVMPNHVHGIIIITDHAGGIGAGFKPARTTMGSGSAAGSVGAGSVGAGSVGAGSEPAPTTIGPGPTAGPGSVAGSGPTTGPGSVAVVVGSGSVGSGSVGAGSEPAPTRSSHGLPEIVRQFKTFSARRINELRGTPGTPVWQRNYYEHIIRDESSLSRIRQYIAENPARWDADQENPQRPHHARRHSPPPPASQRENPTPPPPKGTPRS